MKHNETHSIEQALHRIEAKLDALLRALAEEEMQHQPTDLSGNTYGGERDDTQPL
jgi:hypothetical protein